LVDGKTFVHHVCTPHARVAVRVHIVADDHIFDLVRDDVQAMGTVCDMVADAASFDAPADADADQPLDEELDHAAIVASAVPLTYERITADCFARVRAGPCVSLSLFRKRAAPCLAVVAYVPLFLSCVVGRVSLGDARYSPMCVTAGRRWLWTKTS
jgi:hypothetical protein